MHIGRVGVTLAVEKTVHKAFETAKTPNTQGAYNIFSTHYQRPNHLKIL